MSTTSMSPDPSSRLLLRHTLATLAYRGGKALRDAPPGFEKTCACEGGRSAGEVLSHVGDLFDWAASMVRGKTVWRASAPLPWDEEVERFFATLSAFDAALEEAADLPMPPERIFQGPIADALTHVGQISMLRRIAGAPVKAENYAVASITVGRVGADQAAPVVEF